MASDGFYRTGFVALLAGCAFLLGIQVAGGSRALAEGGPSVPQPGGGGGDAGATADSDRNMIAVTGVSPTGAAVLYLVDSRSRRLAVYQWTGKNIELVAARNIEYDLTLLDSYHDASPDEVAVPRLRDVWKRRQGDGKAGDGGGK